METVLGGDCVSVVWVHRAPEKSITTTNQLSYRGDHSPILMEPNCQKGSPFYLRISFGYKQFNLKICVAWYAGTEILCPETAPEADATTRCEGAVDADVTFDHASAVRDPDNARADASGLHKAANRCSRSDTVQLKLWTACTMKTKSLPLKGYCRTLKMWSPICCLLDVFDRWSVDHR